MFEARGAVPARWFDGAAAPADPLHVAMDLLLTAREVPAEEALRIGLIGRVVPDGTALDEALEIAEVICGERAAGGRGHQASVRETEGMSEVDGLASELEIGWPIFATEDAKRARRPSPRSAQPTIRGVSEGATRGGVRRSRGRGEGHGVGGAATSTGRRPPQPRWPPRCGGSARLTVGRR